jgi:hypothetical protein
MKHMHKTSILLVLFATVGILVCSTKIGSLMILRTPVSCDDLSFINLDPVAGDARCENRLFIFGKYNAITLKKFPGSNPLRIQFNKNEDNLAITGQIIKAPGTMKLATPDGKIIWQSSGVGTEWSGATRSLVTTKDDRQTLIWTSNSEFEYEIILSPGALPNLRSNLVTALSVVIVLGVGFLCAFGRNYSAMTQISLLMSLCVVVILSCGMPYGSTTGWFDPGDDTSYFHWTYNLGYLLDPYLTHGRLQSWASDHNHHSWGTGLMLAPFLIPARIMAPNLGPSSLHFGLVNFGVIIWGCLSIYVMFRTFSLVTAWRSALIVALFSVVSTSALKWMFMRNFFSHIPELLAVGCASYCIIRRYIDRELRARIFLGMLISLWLATQIRRENIALFAIPFLYEWLLNTGRNKKYILWYSGIIASVSVMSIITLLATNYFTKLGAFFTSSQTHSYFRPDKFWQMLTQNGPEVLWREDYGLFYWKNAYPWLALGAICLHRRSWRHWAPLSLITIVYLMMCILYEYPNGMEWQNRFLLKLNPILFGGALIFLKRAPKPMQIAGWSWMIASALMELGLYRRQLPAGMNFYISDLTDHSLMFPQLWPGINMYIFYLPLIFVSFVSALFWIRVYWTTCNAQSLGDRR